MSFPRYPAYKDSGVEWLGEVPGHWSVKKIGHIADLIAGFAFPSDRFEFVPESGIPLVRGDNVTEGWLRWGEKGRYWPHGAEYDARYLLAHDDILVQMDGSKVGKNWALVGESDLPALLVQRVTRVRVNGALPKFIYSFIANEMFIRYVDRAKTDPAIPHITMKDIADYWITLPPLPEQTQIATFLDRETAKIDELVAEQRRLMELLKEKRRAVISHAVTRGLNPDAPMRPSGIEWLGDVPVHWAVKRLKYLLAENGLVRGPFGGDLKKEIFQASGEKVYEQKNAIYRDHQLGDSYISAMKYAAMMRFQVRAGDYIMSCSGTIGKTYRLPENAPDGIINQALLIIRFTKQVCFQYADWIFDSEFFVKQILDNSQGGAMKNLVGMDVFTSISLPVPPNDEQLSISRYLDAESAKFDTLTTEAQRAIDLLQERRTALISAAVTGQIDVRGVIQ